MFDIAYVLIDVIALFPGETTTFEVGPRDHLSHFLRLISAISNGESRFIGLLQSKIREVLPSMAASLNLAPTSAPSPGISSLRRIDSSSESAASSSYAGSPAMSGSSRLTPSSTRFPIVGHLGTSSPELGGNVIPVGMSSQDDMASPMGSIPDGVGQSGANIQDPYHMHFPPGSGYHR